jgi:hypothetical protein
MGTEGRVRATLQVANNRDVQMAEGGALPPERVHWFELEGVVDTGRIACTFPKPARTWCVTATAAPPRARR